MFEKILVNSLHEANKRILESLEGSLENKDSGLTLYTLYDDKRGLECDSFICYTIKGLPENIGEDALYFLSEAGIDEACLEDIRYANGFDDMFLKNMLILKLADGITVCTEKGDFTHTTRISKEKFVDRAYPGITGFAEITGKFHYYAKDIDEEIRKKIEDLGEKYFSPVNQKISNLNKESDGLYSMRLEINLHKTIGTSLKVEYLYPWKKNLKNNERVGDILQNFDELIHLTLDNYPYFIEKAEEVY